MSKRNANDKMLAWVEGISKMELKPNEETNIDEATYDKVHMAYTLMKNLLIEMNGYGDLEEYDTEDIFKLIAELEQDE